MTAADRIVDALQANDCRPRRSGQGWSARCPAHHDRRPSLSIGVAREFAGVVLHCQAGCPIGEVLSALGLTVANLFDEPRARARGYEVTAEYPYVDEAGAVLFVQERRFPKDFRVKRPNGTGFTYGLGNTRRVLYRLPEVLAAVQSGQTVHIVEGERDADALAALGLTATTSPLGAGKWRPEYGDTLTGADVLIVADRDKAGIAHATTVAKDLDGKAKSVSVMQAATGKDVSDHLAAGHNLAELVELVQDDQVVDDQDVAEVDDQDVVPVAPGDPEADLDNARHLAAKYGEKLRYVVPWKKWLCWDGRRWAADDTGQVSRYAKAVADTLPGKAGNKPGRARTHPGIAAMIALAGTEPGIAIAPGSLDADPYLLNVLNGTLDLRTGELRAHDPGDLLTKIAGAAYHPDAVAPTFDKFLARVQPDQEVRDFLARLFGHACLGKVEEHLLAILYGIGANGKTTLAEAVSGVFGDYAAPVDPGLLIDRGDSHPTGVAALFGLRLALTHETDAGRRLAEGTVKRLTGGDTITARRMREDFWTFKPSHSLLMLTNHKPIVTGTDEGIWRRLRFVPFPVVIPDEEQDPKLPDRLRLEADGILAWAVRGYRQWQDRGLAEPEQVTEATAAFRGESDMLGLFIDERCMQMAAAHVQSAVLFAAWADWCRRENVDAGTQTAFSRALQDRGYDKVKGRSNKVWRGIGLYADEEDPS